MRKPDVCLCENKGADQLRSYCESDQRLYFRYTVQFLFYLNPKFQASSLLLGLYRPICVRPGRKSQRPVFSLCGSYVSILKCQGQMNLFGYTLPLNNLIKEEQVSLNQLKISYVHYRDALKYRYIIRYKH